VFELIGGGLLAVLFATARPFTFPILPYLGRGLDIGATTMIIIGAILAILGIVAIAGGVSAIRRGSFGLSLVGAICALPSGLAGLLAVIFVSLAKGEFEASY
jgi:hypothetical protein